jgi:hypothetical protein
MFGVRTRVGVGAVSATLVLMASGVGTTVQAGSNTASVLSCAAKQVTHVSAPGPHRSATFPAGYAGEVKVLETGDQTLKVQSVTVRSGWRYVIKVGEGTAVRVNFFAAQQRQLRFVARLNSLTGRLTVTVVRCG